MAYLGDKNVGDIVKIKEDGVAVNYLIAHKGKPSDLYDDSCDGVWVLRQDIYTKMAWDSSNNSYKDSDIHTYLNGTFLNLFDSDIKAAIKQVKIPYQNGTGSGGSVASGSNGLSAKIFLLSGYELGWTTSNNSYFPVDGAKLSYFTSGTDAASNNKRIANYSGSATNWWLRSPIAKDTGFVWYVYTNGFCSNHSCANSFGVRPALILDASLLVDDDGNVTTNNPPTITADKTGDLGTLTDGFTCNYSVDDADESDNLTVAEFLDDTQTKSFSATRNEQRTISYTGNDWLKIANGSHSIKISCSDSKDTVDEVITFTRDCKQVLLKLENPFPADDVISVCSLTVDGSIPADAVCKYEVTNNALDDEPVWEDCTNKSRAGFGYVFKNKTAENGFAFNFRVTISRGESGSGGYITSISGGFE